MGASAQKQAASHRTQRGRTTALSTSPRSLGAAKAQLHRRGFKLCGSSYRTHSCQSVSSTTKQKLSAERSKRGCEMGWDPQPPSAQERIRMPEPEPMPFTVTDRQLLQLIILKLNAVLEKLDSVSHETKPKTKEKSA
jgi:hypothetical protein